MNSWPTLKEWYEFSGTLLLELLILFAAAKLINLRLHSAQWRRCIWQIVMVAMFLVVAGEVNGVRGLIRLPHKAPPATPTRAVVVTVKDAEFPMETPPLLTFTPSLQLAPEPATSISHWRRHVIWPALVWCSITVLLLGRILVAQAMTVAFRLPRRRNVDSDMNSRVARIAELFRIRRPIIVANSAKAIAPFTFGVWRFVIVLPFNFKEAFTPEQQDAALAHELAHVARFDSAWRTFSHFVCALLWWNPFAWLAKRELDHASELVADESSLLLADGPNRLAECLVACAKQTRRPTAVAWLGMDGGGFRSALGQRVARLLQLNPRSSVTVRVPWYLRIVAPILCVGVLWFGMAMMKSGEQRGGSWRTSILGSAFAAAAETTTATRSTKDLPIEVARLVQDGKLLYEAGRLEAARTNLIKALRIDPTNKAAAYYLDLVRIRHLNEAARKLDSESPAVRETNAPTSPNLQTNAPALHTRFFKVDPNVFPERLKSIQGSDTNLLHDGRQTDAPSGTRITEVTPAPTMIPMVQSWFHSFGVDEKGPDKAVFYNDRLGVLMVRATPQDLDAIEKAIQMLNMSPPQLTISVKVVELSKEDIGGLGFNWYLGNTLLTNSATASATDIVAPAKSFLKLAPISNAIPSGAPQSASITGVLTEDQFRRMTRALEQRDGADFSSAPALSAPAVTTHSGRQAQIKVVDNRPFITGLNTNGAVLATNKGVTISDDRRFLIEEFDIGSVVDVVPYVLPDGYTIDVNVLPSLREFLGYDTDPIWATGGPFATPPPGMSITPKFRLRTVATSARVWDGQTIVVGPDPARRVMEIRQVNGGPKTTSYTDKALLFFITPRLIDPAGNPIHSDEELRELHKKSPDKKQIPQR